MPSAPPKPRECESVQFSPTIPVDVAASSNFESRSKSVPAEAAPEPEHLPKVGEEFLGFELIEELGRGSFGRVYLAKQRDLADRPVALKISFGPDAESQNLARLQHANIMPIYSAHRMRRAVAVCMPFFGRTTLADLCTDLDSLEGPPFSGGQLVGTLAARTHTTRSDHPSISKSRADDSASQPPSVEKPPVDSVQPILDMLRTMSYVEAVLWIATRVAEGLAHAHERGIIHRDLKPANVLLADDGQPMILDFNLAMDTRATGEGGGGTLPYMSPEQLRMLAGQADSIDARSDIYSLGIVFAQLLSGKYPFPIRKGYSRDRLTESLRDREGPLPKLPKENRAISPAVVAIVHKCLEFKPETRYQSARDLIEDLELHRANRPLKHAPNHSLRERAAKWARRHPKLFAPPVLAAMLAAVLLVAAAGFGAIRVSAERSELARNAQRGREIVGEFDVLQGSALQYLASNNGNPELLNRGRTDGFRALETLIDGRGDNWKDRPEFQHLPEMDKAGLAEKASELVYLIGRSSESKSNDPEFWNRISTTFSPGRSTPLLRASERHAEGKFRESLPELERWTRENPGDANGWFLLGRALAETERLDDAYLAYSSAIALRPRYAAGYFFRSALADQLKKADAATGRPQALIDADRAVELDPEFLEARFVRAQLRAKLKLWNETRDDLDAILEASEAPTRAWLLRSKVRAALGDKTGAEADRTEGLKREPTTAADFIARGTARIDRDPQAALADYKAAEALDPRNFAALENQAYLQAEILNRPELAVETLGRSLERNPNSPLIHICRAVYQARCGQLSDAVSGAKRALELNPGPGIQYRAACVYALAAKTEPKYAAPALKHLAAALKSGFGFDDLPTDTDLDPLRSRADFSRLAELAKLLVSLGAPK